jgi:alpha-glucoside transport system permease protein
MFQKDPDQGAVNAAIKVVRDAVVPAGVLTSANAATPTLQGNADQGFVLRTPLRAGGTALMGLTAIPPAEVPKDAVQAVQPKAQSGAITGVVWRDFKPGGGKPGVVERGEQGIPGATVQLKDDSGKVVKTEKTSADGSFTFSGVGSGTYRAAISKDTFEKPFAGVAWLGPKLITPACIIAYIWVWAGFSMVVIAAGLAAISREVLEAARTDGATEWQVFRRITVPMLAPVLTVVFVTMLINVLKVFDIILSVAPGSSQDDANVIALAMWRTSFGGVNDFGLGSAIATFLFVLVIPALLLNVRRFRREES